MRILQLKRGLIIEGNDYDGMCFERVMRAMTRFNRIRLGGIVAI